jgi:TolB-like protein/DNA-binding winged helix-turn-helix (wHTH) protein/tetratricopeptide (TPR) repeat protein
MEASVQETRSARFGAFELDMKTGELRKNGVRVRLQEQPQRLLATLLTHAGELVTREELRNLLWPADTFVDFDHSLNTAVRKLRAALDDSAETPRFIETMARRGYRFIAPVEWASAAVPRSGVRRPLLWLAAAALILGASLTAWSLKRTPEAVAHRDINSIAVLPFSNSDKETEYISDGLAESLIDEISSPDLRVIAWTSSLRFKDKPVDPRAAGKELSVSAVVTGRLSRDGADHRLHAELIDVRDGAQLWSGQYRGSTSGLGVMQRRVAADISLRLGVTRADRKHVLRDSPAYESYLRGRYLWNKRTGRDVVLRSIEYFDRAIELDPDFAPAFAGLCQAWGVIHGNRWMPGQEKETQEKATAAGERALQLDQTLAEAHTCLGGGRMNSRYWDFAGAERDFRRAIALNPNYATAHQWYSTYLTTIGDHDGARREIDLAWQLDPFSPAVNRVACFQRFAHRRYDEAIDFSRRAADIDPSFASPQCLVSSQLAAGRLEEAIAEMRFLDQKSRDELADALRGGGSRLFWRALSDRSIRSRAPFYFVAAAQAVAGDHDQAFASLDAAYEHRESGLAYFYEDPRFDPLRSDPRFDQLARRIGLPQARGVATARK